MEKRASPHLYSFALVNTNEIAASAQDPAPFSNAVVFGNPGSVTAQYLPLADLEIAEDLTFTPAASYRQHSSTNVPASIYQDDLKGLHVVVFKDGKIHTPLQS